MSPDAAAGALAPYRILDLTTERSWLTGKLLADLGADVIKVEPAGGDPGRRRGPFADDVESPENCLAWWAYNRGKRSITAALDTAAGRELLLRLAADADAVLESYSPGQLERWGLGPETLSAANPAMVVTRVTPFGQTGPYADLKANDLVLAAVGGPAWMAGDSDRPPVRTTAPQYFLHAAAEAALHTVVALYHAARTGQGQQIDVSAQLAAVRTLMNAMAHPHTDGKVLQRVTFGEPRAASAYRSVFACADGYVMASIGFAPGVKGFLGWLRDEGALTPPLAELSEEELGPDVLTRQPAGFPDRVSDAVEAFFAGRDKRHITGDALARRLLVVPINNVADIRADEQLDFRGYFTPVDHDGRPPVSYPSTWVHLTATPLAATARAPHIGEHDGQVAQRRPPAGGAGARPAATRPAANGGRATVRPEAPAATGTGTGVFAGLKVWDAAWVGVGPITSRYLADYGATVVHTESTRNPDVLRLAAPFRDGVAGIDRSQFFADYNCSKFGLGVDLAHERGRDVALRLAEWADVVVESFSPGVMDKFGLGYAELSARNPSLVMLSTSMNGQTGPRRKFAGFGTVMAAVAGFCETTGWPDRRPGSPYGAYTDFVCQRLCGTALVAALDHRRRTGQGQHLDLAQYEGSLQMLATWLLDHEVNGRTITRDGNRSPDAAPHGIYPCLEEGGGERWIAIAVEDDGQWSRLVELMGGPDWATDEGLRTFAGRKAREDVVDAHLGAWTAGRRRQDIFHLLQPHVAAAPVNDGQDLHDDPQIVHRGYLVELAHTVMGPTLYEGTQARMSLTPAAPTKAAPCLGEDTTEVLRNLLGYDEVEVDELLRAGAVEQYVADASTVAGPGPR